MAGRLNKPATRWRVAGFALLLWVISLALPAISIVANSPKPVALRGYQVLQAGWIDMVAGQFGWLANLAFIGVFIGLTSYSVSPRLTRWFAVSLMLFSVDTVDLVLRPVFYEYPQLLAGYYVWTIANIGIAIFAIIVSTAKPSLESLEA